MKTTLDNLVDASISEEHKQTKVSRAVADFIEIEFDRLTPINLSGEFVVVLSRAKVVDKTNGAGWLDSIFIKIGAYDVLWVHDLRLEIDQRYRDANDNTLCNFFQCIVNLLRDYTALARPKCNILLEKRRIRVELILFWIIFHRIIQNQFGLVT